MNRRDARCFVFAFDVLFFALMIPVALVMGCHAHKRVNAVTIPPRCMHAITIDDFSKPCEPVHGKPNEGMCDRVHIRFACVDYTQQK
jgi:hypothetical protein